jgi:hypothetical protein
MVPEIGVNEDGGRYGAIGRSARKKAEIDVLLDAGQPDFKKAMRDASIAAAGEGRNHLSILAARMRTLPEGVDQRSASRHPDWTGPDDLVIKIKELREITDWEKPIYVKVGATRVFNDVKLAVRRIASQAVARSFFSTMPKRDLIVLASFLN